MQTSHSTKTSNSLFNAVCSQLENRVKWIINNEAIVFCEDDKQECLQRLHIKIFELTEKFERNELSFNDSSVLIKYVSTSLKNCVRDYNRQQMKRSQTFTEFQDVDLEMQLETGVKDPSQDAKKTLKRLESHMAQANPQAWDLLYRRFIEEKTPTQIASELLLTESQVSRITKNALSDVHEMAKYLKMSSDILHD
ncbi:sigma-70 family RNA polymerase sigma factor [Vibrio metschnikovii]|nr:sigma-70 family RNA polymerase sigma factor [Vibrio metschnikovii]